MEQTSVTTTVAIEGTPKKTSKTTLYAIVKVAHGGMEQTEILTASFYKELSELLKNPNITEIVQIVRGRTIPFRKQNTVKFF